jgi:CHAD domain-containing protein
MPSTPRAPASIEELCAKFENENGHSRHVASLALKLFDATHVLFGVPAQDRVVLEAACRLHDVAYGVNTRHHAEIGARIVRTEGLAGYNTLQIRSISAIIRLHSSGLSFEKARLAARRAPDPPRVLYSAALLRIADALDSCHLQDASIASVRVTKLRIRVGVRCGHFPKSVEAARHQAGLWREAFPVDIDFRLLASGSAPLVGRGVTLHEAVRRLLFQQFGTLLINVGGALEANGNEALHDLRIAIRRMRSVLRAFPKPLAETSAHGIERDLQQLNRVLGIARDLDVWIGFFSSESVSLQFTGHRLWAKFVAHQLELRRLQQSTVRRQLHGARFTALRIRISRFLRVELPRASGSAPEVPAAGPARRAIDKTLRRALELGHLRQSRSPEKLHRLRIALRRVRYLGAFFGPALGRSVRKLSRRTHALERVLGEIRDADLALVRIQQEGPTPPRMLVRQLERIRQANAATLESAWTRFEDPQFILGLRRQLKSPE